MMRRTTVQMLLCALLGLTTAASYAKDTVIQVFKSEGCSCCEEWIKHLEKNGFTVKAQNVSDTSAYRTRLGIPQELGSCHTASVDEYAIEGHVPAADIKRLLNKRPNAVGLAVPSMPPGSPGMEGPSRVPYDVFLVKEEGQKSVFNHYE